MVYETVVVNDLGYLVANVAGNRGYHLDVQPHMATGCIHHGYKMLWRLAATLSRLFTMIVLVMTIQPISTRAHVSFYECTQWHVALGDQTCSLLSLPLLALDCQWRFLLANDCAWLWTTNNYWLAPYAHIILSYVHSLFRSTFSHWIG